jgi:hypothetical protein
MGVTRGSFFGLTKASPLPLAILSASTTIVRNLYISNWLQRKPIRRCRKMIGPRLVSLIRAMMPRKRGARRVISTVEAMRSTARLTLAPMGWRVTRS